MAKARQTKEKEASRFSCSFQTFDDTADPSSGKARLAALRKELRRRKLDGFVVPHADEHQSEYLPASAERLAWLTGFTGSAGTCVVLSRKAAVFVDGRYTLQVLDQVDTDAFTPVPVANTSVEEWIGVNLRRGEKLGVDPMLTTQAGFERLQRAAAVACGEIVAVDGNPLDAVWTDRPAPPLGAVSLHPPALSGETTARKLARARDALGKAEVLLVSDPQNIAWLFNIRGKDVAHTPVALAFALVPKSGVPVLYIDARKLDRATARALGKDVRISAPAGMQADLARLAKARRHMQVDQATAPARLVHDYRAAGGTVDLAADPLTAMKAVKNATELAGTRAAHLRDGAAMVRFLAWFDAQAPKGRLTEIDAVEALETFRRDTGALVDISFATISGSGPNGAIVHYRVTRKTSRRIGRGLFLIDSGGQYRDGTTDITRTIAVGAPTREMRDRFTRVLRGHIAIATAQFPAGTSGAQIDAFARRALWDAGIDYAHGTGHGVGSFLSVHEGPQNISKRGSVALEAGMILSNEPGYYRTGAWGIRIENLVVVERRKVAGAEHDMLGFETLTLAPVDLRLVDTSQLTREELRWLDAYHARVRKVLAPQLDRATRTWLVAATKPLSRG